MNSKELGNLGEKIAQDYLRKKGYRILDVNFKRKWGEIDIVAKKRGEVIFVEVKTISQKEEFSPEDEINWKKKKQLRKMAQIYLLENKIPLNHPYQIDIMAVEISPDFQETSPEFVEGVKVRHYQNAIEDNY